MEVKHILTIVSVGALSAATAGFAGYKYAEKVLGREFDERLDREIEQVMDFYAVHRTADGHIQKNSEPDVPEDPETEIDFTNYQTPVTVVTDKADLEEIIHSHGYSRPEKKRPGLPEGVRIFWDEDQMAKEVASRDGKDIYIIAYDEYNFEDEIYENETVVYYSVDDVLVNVKDIPIDDFENLIGTEFADKFGHGSGDPNIVYVQNDRLNLRYEISQEIASYFEANSDIIAHSGDYEPKVLKVREP